MTAVAMTLKNDPLADIRVDVKTPRLGQYVGRKRLDFSVDGATGTQDILTVSGDIMLSLLAICRTNLAGATATIEVGVAGEIAKIIAQTTGTLLIADEIWNDASPDASVEPFSALPVVFIAAGKDVILTIATAALTAGVIDFYAWYEPIAGGKVVVA